jgi:hypothetical protein
MKTQFAPVLLVDNFCAVTTMVHGMAGYVVVYYPSTGEKYCILPGRPVAPFWRCDTCTLNVDTTPPEKFPPNCHGEHINCGLGIICCIVVGGVYTWVSGMPTGAMLGS